MAVEQALQEFRETESGEAFSLQNDRLLKVELAAVTIQAKLGSMVAYQGDVKFERAGTGGMGRLMKKMATGEGVKLMMVSGSGEVFLADHAQEVHLVKLADDKITVNSSNLLAFELGDRLGHPQGGGRLRRARRRPVQSRAVGLRLGRAALRRPPDAAAAEGRPRVRRPAGGDHVVKWGEDHGQDGRRT